MELQSMVAVEFFRDKVLTWQVTLGNVEEVLKVRRRHNTQIWRNNTETRVHTQPISTQTAQSLPPCSHAQTESHLPSPLLCRCG